MVDYESDTAIQEIEDEMYHREYARKNSNSLSSMGTTAKFIIGLGLALLFFFYINKTLTGKQILMFLVAGGIIYLFMSQKQADHGELTDFEFKLRIERQLKLYQNHPIGDVPQVPKGLIWVKLIGRKQWYEGQGFKRSCAVDIFDKDRGTWEHYFIEGDIITGDIMTAQYKPDGVRGDETKDIKLMPTMGMLLEKRKSQYLDKAYHR